MMLCLVLGIIYILEPEALDRDLELFCSEFRGLSVFFAQWMILLAVVSLITFPATRHHVASQNICSSFLYGLSIVVTFAIIFTIPFWTMMKLKLTYSLRVATMAEQIRFFFKMVSFLVENGKKNKCLQDGKESTHREAPTFKSFLYFMFAPTLIYRDQYPIAKTPTNWKLVASYAAQIVAFMIVGTALVSHQLQPRFRVIGIKTLTAHEIAGFILWSFLLAVFILLVYGYAIVHCWHNMFAEIMNFGDRLFYKDWMLAGDIMDFMRTWNYLIHSWIMEYLYKPCMRLTGSKPFAFFYVMAVAGVFHDYAINTVHMFILLYESTFLPFLLLIACWAQMVSHLSGKKGANEHQKMMVEPKHASGTNIKLILALYLVNTLECLICGAEYFAVQNCPKTEPGWRSIAIVPHLFSCFEPAQ